MRLAGPLPARPGRVERQSAAAVLGADHPLARAADLLDATIRQTIAVWAVLGGSIAATCARANWAPAIAVSAAIVGIGLIIVGASYRQRQTDCALDLILQGREKLPVAAVQHQRRRLIDPRTRQDLARALETIIHQTTTRQTIPTRGTARLFDVRVIAAVRTELATVAALLRDGPRPVSAVAYAERLVTDGRSPLYGHSIQALRCELHRARSLLGG